MPHRSACTAARALSLLLAPLLGLTGAPVLADPMRPLGGAATRPAPERAATAGSAPVAAEAGAARAAEPRLVAIRQDSVGHWHALFDERWLGVGERLGNRTVAAIDAGQVTLRQGRQTQTLHLLPTLQYRAEAREPAASAARPNRTERAAARRANAISTAQTAGEATP